MAITVVTAASTRLLADPAEVMGESGIEDLALVERLLAQASAAIERYCGTIFAQQTYAETFGRQRDPALGLRYGPLAAITSVLMGDTAVTDYRILSHEAPHLWREWGWWWRPLGLDVLTVTYTAGYVLPGQVPPVLTGPALPADLTRACIEAVKVWQHELAPSERVTAKTFGLTGDRVEYSVSATKGALPPMSKMLLGPYRRLAVA